MASAFMIANTHCCGIQELVDISRLSGPEAVIKETVKLMADRTAEFRACPAFLMFSGVVGERKRVYETYLHANRSDDYANNLAQYIRDNNLGVVSESEPARNHSGNMLKVFIWAPRWEALKEMWQKADRLRNSLAVEPITGARTEPVPTYTLTIDTVTGNR